MDRHGPEKETSKTPLRNPLETCPSCFVSSTRLFFVCSHITRIARGMTGVGSHQTDPTIHGAASVLIPRNYFHHLKAVRSGLSSPPSRRHQDFKYLHKAQT
jgi:hypothetical protein